MKKGILYILLVCFYSNYVSQTVVSNCFTPVLVAEKYKNDADRLAIRRVNALNSSYKDSVVIHPQFRNDYLSALAAVYNATVLGAVDTITRFLDIHTYNPGLNALVIVADSNLIWMNNLRYHHEPTQDAFIDRMMLSYDLKRVFYSGLLQPSMVVFKSETNYNLAALANKIKKMIGVAAAEAEFLYGDGNDIRDSISTNFTELVYSYGWQECSFGCEQRRYWKFRVYSDCSVEYLGSYGNALEASVLLKVTKNEALFDELNLYNNPIKPKIYIDVNNTKLVNTSVTIVDKNEKVVYSINKINKHQEIDLIRLSVGVYKLELKNNSKTKVYQLKKQ